MPGPVASSSFQRMQQMGPSSGGMGGSNVGIFRSFFGMDSEQQWLQNIAGGEEGKAFTMTGANNMEEGVLAKLFAMRGDGLLGSLLSDILEGRDTMGGMNNLEDLDPGYVDTTGDGGGGGGGESGSNHGYSSLPAMGGMGEMMDVPTYQLGAMTPSPSPGMGGGMGMGAGMDM